MAHVGSAHRLRAAVALLVLAATGLLVTGTAEADTSPPAGTPATVSADRLATWQINGVVWSQAVAGSTVVAGGSFTKARPPGVSAGGPGEVAAQNLFGYDITTGNRLPAWSHSVNGQILAVTASPDRSVVYVGGDFTTVDGSSRGHIAAFDAASGALLSTFRPSISGSVKAIAVSSSTVYAGGTFTRAANADRNHLAAFNPADGALTSWTASADDNRVSALAVTTDGTKLIVGGRFTRLNGVVASGMGAVSTQTGATLPWAANKKITNGGDDCGITSLRAAGNLVFGSGFAYGCGNFEGVFIANTGDGSLVAANDCHGDTYDTFPLGQVVYSVSHAHDCRWIGGFPESNPRATNMRHALAFTTYATRTNTGPDSYGWDYRGVGASTLLQWFPELTNGSYTGQTQAAWSVSGNDDYIVLGGEFPRVNDSAQQGLVRFARKGLAANQRGPVRAANAPSPTASAQSSSSVRVTWQSAYDMDNANLTYDVYRSGTAQPVYSTTAASSFWSYPNLQFTDQGMPGGTFTYTVRATDPLGNTITFPATGSVTVAGGGNTPPSAAFTSSSTGLSASFNASGSSDPGGSIASYAWSFGDGTSGSGVTTGHDYGAPGTYQVTLTVTDNSGATNSVTKPVTVTAPAGGNTPPTAAFTSSSTGLTASFDGSGSSDPDPGGSVTGYAWSFGDGATGSGATTSHPYAAAGTYQVTLTVTDDSGATNAVTKPVTVTGPGGGPALVGSDSFGRTTTNGWGTADQGGAWAVTGGASSFSVGAGVGSMNVSAAGAGPSATLGGVSTSRGDTQVTFVPQKLASGGGTYVSIIGRSVSGVGSYRATVTLKSNGTATIGTSKVVGSTTTGLSATTTVGGLTYAAGDSLSFRLRAVGTTPTTIQARVWRTGQPEPSTWQATASDSTSTLQKAGSVGLVTYLSGSTTNAPAKVSYDDLRVYDAQ